jgi:Gram-negative bacterial TonB protein C-terminal
MKKTLAALFVSLCLLAIHIIAQDKVRVSHRMKGVVLDQNSAVVVGLQLQFKKNSAEAVTFTGVNGDFAIDLAPGDYEINADAINPSKFKVFVKIVEDGPNPDQLELVVDSDQICCSSKLFKSYPKVITSATPTFPPAARAVRAMGIVKVSVKVDKSGSVTAAKAESGHPLLRATSVTAARKYVFEPSDGVEERDVSLTFVFLTFEEEKSGLVRYSNPYRTVLVAAKAEINY